MYCSPLVKGINDDMENAKMWRDVKSWPEFSDYVNSLQVIDIKLLLFDMTLPPLNPEAVTCFIINYDYSL